MNFELPPIKDLTAPIESLEVAELASAPSTSLMSLANTMVSQISKLTDQASQLKSRYNKIKGEISAIGSGDGRTTIDNITSIAKIGSSMKEMVGPVASTTTLMKDIKNTGSDIITNATAAGTTEDDAESLTTKIGNLFGGIL
jgi:hypothetical protein